MLCWRVTRTKKALHPVKTRDDSVRKAETKVEASLTIRCKSRRVIPECGITPKGILMRTHICKSGKVIKAAPKDTLKETPEAGRRMKVVTSQIQTLCFQEVSQEWLTRVEQFGLEWVETQTLFDMLNFIEDELSTRGCMGHNIVAG